MLGAMVPVACSLLDPIGEEYTRGSPDAGAFDNGLNPNGCRPKHWPAPPSENSEPNLKRGFISAFESFSLSETPDTDIPAVGYDLDGVCSESCRPTGQRDAEPEPDGVDNQFNKLFSFALSVKNGPFVTPDLYIRKGELGALIQISNYNGGPNDTEITVGIALSRGTPLVDGGHPAPQFDGRDTWSWSSRDASVSQTAYVSMGTLVAEFPTFIVPLGPYGIRIQHAFLIGQVTVDGAGVRIDEGRIVGRVLRKEVLSLVGIQEEEGKLSCNKTGIYQNVLDFVCPGADILANGGTDPGANCDALSIAVRIKVSPALKGEQWDRDEIQALCGEADDCP
jgi:hypothetical protein